MKITALNLDIRWKSPEENINIIEEKLKDEQADVFLLPEMFTTGFCVDTEEVADSKGETLAWMKRFAEKKKSAVGGSVSVKENGQMYNRFYFVEPSGKVHQYDKRHLFSFGGEDKIYTAGKERVVVDYKGVRFLLLVCYDLRFPVFARNVDNYDVMIDVASWAEPRILAWETLLRARAIENQSFVFGVNRIGIDGSGLNYPESTRCFYADGTEISEKKGDIVSANIDLEKLNSFRQKFKVLLDRDEFELK